MAAPVIDASNDIAKWQPRLGRDVAAAYARLGGDAQTNVDIIAYPAAIADSLARLVRSLGSSDEWTIELGRKGPALTSAQKRLADIGFVLDETVRAAAPEFSTRTIITARRWSDAPNFHVDQAAITWIFPLLNAPTHFAPDEREASVQMGPGQNLPLAMATRRAAPPKGRIETSGDGALVALKGLGWDKAHAPLVHSPPTHAISTGRAPNILAHAVIVETTRQ